MGVIGDARNNSSGGAALYGSALWTSIEGSFAGTSPTASGLSRPGRHLLPRQRVSFSLVDGQGGVGVVEEHLHPFLGVHVDTDLPGGQLLLGERLRGVVTVEICRRLRAFGEDEVSGCNTPSSIRCSKGGVLGGATAVRTPQRLRSVIGGGRGARLYRVMRAGRPVADDAPSGRREC